MPDAPCETQRKRQKSENKFQSQTLTKNANSASKTPIGGRLHVLNSQRAHQRSSALKNSHTQATSFQSSHLPTGRYIPCFEPCALVSNLLNYSAAQGFRRVSAFGATHSSSQFRYQSLTEQWTISHSYKMQTVQKHTQTLATFTIVKHQARISLLALGCGLFLLFRLLVLDLLLFLLLLLLSLFFLLLFKLFENLLNHYATSDKSN